MLFFWSLLSCTSTHTDAIDSTHDTGIELAEFPIAEEYVAITESLFAEMTSMGAENGAIAIFSGTELLHTQAFGEAPNGETLNPNARFRIGSLTNR